MNFKFQHDFPGIESITNDLLIPLLGENSKVKNEDILKSHPDKIKDAQAANIVSIDHVGEYDLDIDTLYVFEVVLNEKARIDYSRVNIQRAIRSLLQKFTAALIFFRYEDNKGDWRISYLYKDKSLSETTSAKRYTYILGKDKPCRTISERFALLEKKEKTVESFLDAFSVEVLSKEFFEGYKELYLDFVEELTGKRMIKESNKWVEITTGKPGIQLAKYFNGDEKAARNYVKIMMGRIVFLYFLQKKGWLGASNNKFADGNKNFMHDLWTTNKIMDEGFYSEYLVPLFYEQLNNASKDKIPYQMPDGKKVFIPYLNGGLFDKSEYCIEDDQTLWFESKHFNNLFDFFSKYNFTIDENDPIDHEIGIDPEMLGRIFENLLEDNKDKGSFYTPKEIVQYMTRQSLIEYIKTRFKADKISITKKVIGSIKSFVNEKECTTFIIEHRVDLNRYLDEVKVCDPAIGSGAFPMGVLTEIFNCKLILNPDMQVKDRTALKKHIIEESIYGVDIEKGAIDIARLRFWLSLVIDEDKPEPLPNLDYKIVVGDSLISSFNGEPIQLLWGDSSYAKKNIYEKDITKLTQNISNLQKKYFESTELNKLKYKLKIRDLKLSLLLMQFELSAELYESKHDWNIALDGKKTKKQLENQHTLNMMGETINKIKSLKKNLNLKFVHFDWKLDFPEVFFPKDTNRLPGFDIVIGNPPYIQLQKKAGTLSKMYESAEFETFAKTGDIYVIFYEKAMSLLAEGGVLSYITSNKWMRAGYGKKLREYFARYNPLQLIDLGPGVFDNATVDTNILLIQNRKTDAIALQAVTLHNRFSLESLDDTPYITLNSVSGSSWTIISPEEQSIKEKIEQYGTPLKDWKVKINFGIKTGYNEAFIIDGETKDRLIAEDPKSEEIIKPLLRGRDIKRYKAEFANIWLITTLPSLKLNIENYPAVKKYLQSFGKSIEQTGEKGSRKKTKHKWFETQDAISYYQEFEKEKIVWKRIGSILRFCFSDLGELALDSTVIATGDKVKYLAAILNSQLHRRELYHNAPKTGTGDSIISVQALSPHSVHYPRSNEEKVVVDIFSKIITKLSKNQDTTQEERQIDLIVYKLYHLTYEEVRVVDHDFWMSKDDYEGYEI